MFRKKTTKKTNAKGSVKPKPTKPEPSPEPKVVSKPKKAKSTPSIWPNISIEEATCSCCGEMASAELLDKIQAFRDACGFPIPFTSIYRCDEYNEKIGGSQYSLHLVSVHNDGYGAVDCGISKEQSKNRWAMLIAARQLGINNLEVCDGHIHIGWAPHGHVMQHRLYWGVSK